MGFSSGHIFALLVLFLALGIIAALQYDKSFNHYQSESNKYQPDTIAHTIVTIRTDMQFHECSNYCTLRGPDFGSRECKAFFISLLGDCHMITNAYANKTEEQFGTTYFKKVSDNLL